MTSCFYGESLTKMPKEIADIETVFINHDSSINKSETCGSNLYLPGYKNLVAKCFRVFIRPPNI